MGPLGLKLDLTRLTYTGVGLPLQEGKIFNRYSRVRIYYYLGKSMITEANYLLEMPTLI